jgi:uncharacterized membrane protein
MNLPPINLPKIPIPFEIPQMMHPYIVHFAIVLPLVILFLEIINLIVKKRTIGVVSFLFALFASAAAIAAFMTGNVDAKLANMDSVIQVHKNLGAYVVVVSMAVVVFKLFSVLIRIGVVKLLYLLILIIYVSLIVKESISGKDLVYNSGVNVKQLEITKNQNIKLIQNNSQLDTDNKENLQVIKDMNATILSLKNTNAKCALEIEQLKKELSLKNNHEINIIEDSIDKNSSQELNLTNIQ